MALTKKKLGWLIFTLSLATSSFSQSDSVTHEPINNKRLAVFVTSSVLAYSGTMLALGQVWYANFDHQPFQFFDDAAEWKQMDKMGHFYSAFQLSDLATRGLCWSNMSSRRSDWIGATTGFLMLSSIELFDGRSAAYGASATDIAANLIGSVFFLTQKRIWGETRVRPKFSFHFTDYANLRPAVLGNGGEEIIKDYNGQTYWLSWNPNSLLGTKGWPKWLDVSLGYGAEAMTSARSSQHPANDLYPYRQYYLSFDLNTAALPIRSKALRAVLSITRFVKIPSPALEFSKNGLRLRGLYF